MKMKNSHTSKKTSHSLKALPQSDINDLVAIFNSGHYVELETKTRILLDQYPDSGFAWKVLGIALQGQGKDALPALQKATKLLPNDAEIHNTLGVVFRNFGQLENAVLSCRRAIELKPDFAEAHNNMGNALQDMGQLNAAITSYGRALENKPGLAEVHCNLGNTLKKLGQLESAVASYVRAIEINPTFAEAHCNLGATLKELGQLDLAIVCYLRALEINPNYAEAHSNLSLVQIDLGQFDNAITSCLRALEIQGDYAEAHINLGNAFKNLGRQTDALACYQRALGINPSLSVAHYNLGNVSADLGQFENALEHYRTALITDPDNAEIHNNLGIALATIGERESAIISFNRALEIRANFADAFSNLGNTLTDLGRLQPAIENYQRALTIEPDNADVYNNLGNALTNCGQLQDAIACYRRALEIKPNLADTHNNLGNALKDLGEIEDAVACYRHALELNPAFASAHCNLGNVLTDQGQLDDAIESYRQALEINPDIFDAQSALLFIQNYLSDQANEQLLKEALFFGTNATQHAKPFTTWPNTPNPSRCLRVGLVSADFRNHPVGYFIESILSALATNAVGRIEVYAYSNHFISDAITERIKNYCHNWRSAVGVSDETLANQIREDGIDILIDLAGHTAKNRLPMFAWKPAPVQVTWLGYFATTGVSAIDYVLADRWIAPESIEAYFVEKIQRMPESYLCFTPPDLDVNILPLPALNNGYITFGCFNNLTKIGTNVVHLWTRILREIPHSRLFLKTKALNHAETRQKIIEQFALHEINADRLILEGAAPRAELLAAYQRVDIALDPFPYPGGTTSVEALWMAVPVLTLAGDRFLSHMGESILQNAGLPDWIASDLDDYVALAVAHANDLQRLASLRLHLRQQVLASPLFNAPRFAQHFEDALREMWQNWCAQQQGQLHES